MILETVQFPHIMDLERLHDVAETLGLVEQKREINAFVKAQLEKQAYDGERFYIPFAGHFQSVKKSDPEKSITRTKASGLKLTDMHHTFNHLRKKVAKHADSRLHILIMARLWVRGQLQRRIVEGTRMPVGPIYIYIYIYVYIYIYIYIYI